MSRRRRHMLLLAAFALVSCSARMQPAATPSVQAAVVRLLSTGDTLPLIEDLTRAYAQEHPEVRFEIETADYATLLNRILAGEPGYLVTSYWPPDEAASGRLWAAPIGQEGIAVIVQADNPVGSLSRGELRALYQGRVSRWSDFGGADQPVNVYSREDEADSRAAFESILMGAIETMASARLAPSGEAMVNSIASDPNGIGYAPMGVLDARVRPLALDGVLPDSASVASNRYPLRSLIYLIGRREPSGDDPDDASYRAFIGWVQSPAGQRIVGERAAALTATETP